MNLRDGIVIFRTFLTRFREHPFLRWARYLLYPCYRDFRFIQERFFDTPECLLPRRFIRNSSSSILIEELVRPDGRNGSPPQQGRTGQKVRPLSRSLHWELRLAHKLINVVVVAVIDAVDVL